MKRYIIIFLAAAVLITGCSRPPEPDAFTNSIYWIKNLIRKESCPRVASLCGTELMFDYIIIVYLYAHKVNKEIQNMEEN